MSPANEARLSTQGPQLPVPSGTQSEPGSKAGYPAVNNAAAPRFVSGQSPLGGGGGPLSTNFPAQSKSSATKRGHGQFSGCSVSAARAHPASQQLHCQASGQSGSGPAQRPNRASPDRAYVAGFRLISSPNLLQPISHHPSATGRIRANQEGPPALALLTLQLRIGDFP